MKPGTMAFSLIIASAVAAAVLQAAGADLSPPAPYLTVDAGANFLTGTTFTDQNGVTTKPKADTGWRADLVFGGSVNKWVAVEGEGGFMRNSFQQSANWYQAVPLLGNVVFRVENSTGFVPYLGAGAGAAWTTLGGGGHSETERVFAYQGKAGVAYKLSRDIMLGIGYKFFSTLGQNYSDRDLKLSHPYASHVALSFTWNIPP